VGKPRTRWKDVVRRETSQILEYEDGCDGKKTEKNGGALMESSAQKWLYGHRWMVLIILYFKFQVQNCHVIFNPPESIRSISLRSTYV
jgi:hypothetical protein